MKTAKILVSLIILSYNALSFSFGQKGCKLAVSSGISLSRSTIDKSNIPEGISSLWHVGSSIGILLHYGFNDNLGIKIGLNNVRNGFVVRQQQSDSSMRISAVGFNHLEMPIGISVNYPISEKYYLKETIGITINRDLNFDQTAQFGNDTLKIMDYNLKIYHNVLYFPLLFSSVEVGKIFKNGNMLSIMLSYYYGFDNIVDAKINFNNGIQLRHNQMMYKGDYFLLGVSYYFSCKKN